MSLGGRPPKYTPERLNGILTAISKRVPYELAAEGNGICEDTLYDWINTGKRDRAAGIDSVLAKFSEDIKNTEMKRVIYHLESIDEKPKNWQADAWILERRWWKHFSSSAPVVEFEKRLRKMEESKGIVNDEAHSSET
jgi:hypothetical protein